MRLNTSVTKRKLQSNGTDIHPSVNWAYSALTAVPIDILSLIRGLVFLLKVLVGVYSPFCLCLQLTSFYDNIHAVILHVKRINKQIKSRKYDMEFRNVAQHSFCA